ncbi:MAG: hypothetical protein ACHREM_23225, partial [Polyangiales bacterium]
MKSARNLRLASLVIASSIGGSMSPVVACHSTRDAPRTAVSASQSASPSTSAVVASASASTSASSKPPHIDPLAALPWRELVAGEAWIQARSAIERLAGDDALSPSVQLARARVLVESCDKSDAEAALKIVDAMGKQTPALVEPLAHLRTVAAYCAERWRDAIAGLAATRRPRELRV